MTNSDEAMEIASEYLKKSGFDEFEIKDAINKIYKWRVEAEGPNGTFAIEITKSDGNVIKFEHN